MRKILMTAVLAALIAPAPVAAAASAEARIAKGFAELGMNKDESACYGRVIDGKLGARDSDRAARIVEGARNAEDVSRGVRRAGFAMMNAFRAARDTCGS
jgi:hypothetical protein